MGDDRGHERNRVEAMSQYYFLLGVIFTWM
jgi:hypothetical protein